MRKNHSRTRRVARSHFTRGNPKHAAKGRGHGGRAEHHHVEGLEQRCLLTAALGPEFRVNTFTAGTQTEMAIAADAGGNFVVVWSSANQDGSGYGVYGQRFNSAGAPRGSEFRVNQYSAGDQDYPVVAMEDNGDFAVSWSSSGQDGSGWGTYARRFSAEGTPLGDEFRVNTYTAGDQYWSSMAMDADGDFVITWRSVGQDGSGSGIYAQRYDSAGVAQGAEFRANSYTANDQWFESVGMDGAGNFLIAWTSEGQDSGTSGIFAQRYDPAGAALGGEFRVNSYVPDSQWNAAAAMGANGQSLVSWQGAGSGDSYSGIFAQRYDAAGAPQGGEFRANTYTPSTQSSSWTAMNADGEFVIVWHSAGQDGSGWGAYAQEFDAAGAPVGGEFRLNTITAGGQIAPAVAMVRNSHELSYVVTWLDDNNMDIMARVYIVSAPDPLLVTTTADVVNPGDNQTSLREAVTYANTHTGADTVRFRADVTGTITLSGGELALTDTTGATTIDGPGAAVLAVSGNDATRVFHLLPGAVVAIDGLTVTLGGTPDNGGGVLNDHGTLSLTDATLSDNRAAAGGGIHNAGGTVALDRVRFLRNRHFGPPWGLAGGAGIFNENGTVAVNDSTFSSGNAYYGGGIHNYAGQIWVTRTVFTGNGGDTGGAILNRGTATVTDSSFTDNIVGSHGGGIYNAGVLTLTGSTVSGSRAWSGGGLYNSGTAMLTNSTFAFNSAAEWGAGIWNYNGTLAVYNSTVAANSMSYAGSIGAGIANWSGAYRAVLHNTIVAENRNAVSGAKTDLSGAFDPTSSYNLIGAIDGSTGLTAANHNLFGSAAAPLDPLLDLWGYHGGPTTTWSLARNSPARDAGGNDLIPAGVTTDQRGQGYPRIYGPAVDIGAFEWINLAPVLADVSRVVDEDTPLSLTAPIFDAGFTDLNGDTLGVVRIVTLPDTAAGALMVAGSPVVAGQEIARGDLASLSFSPAADYNGPASFAWNGADGELWALANARVQITVNPINDAPRLVQTIDPVVVKQDAGHTVIDLSEYFYDPEVAAGTQWLSGEVLSSDPNVVFAWVNYASSKAYLLLRYPSDYNGTAQVTVTVKDQPFLTSASTTFEVTVLPEYTIVEPGPEVRVAPSGGGGNWPAVEAMDADGDFVVVSYDRHDPAQGDYSVDINARLFSKDGDPISGTILVNTYRFSDGYYDVKPGVAMDADGDFVVTWQSVGQDGSGWGVYARRYDAAGQPLDAQEFLVNQTTSGNQMNSVVGMDGAGNFTVVWQGAGNGGDDIFARRYSASGAALSDEYVVNSLEGFQTVPAVGMNTTGDTVISWTADDRHAWARRFGADGVALGPAFRIDTAEQPVIWSALGVDATGGFVVGWWAFGAGEPGNWADVHARRFDAEGVPLGPQFRVTDFSYPGEVMFSLSVADDGSFVTTYMGDAFYQWDVYAKVYDAAGEPLGSQFRVNTVDSAHLQPGNGQGGMVPTVAMARNGGSFVVVMNQNPGWTGEAPFFRLYQLNRPPTTTGIANVIVDEDAPQTAIDLWAAFADDLDADSALIYSVQANSNPALFSSAQIDPTTGRLLLNYPANVFGHSALTLRATDTGGLFVETSFTVAVNPVNDAPVVSALTLDRTAIDEGQSVNLTGRITDVDAGDSHTLTIDWGDGTSSDNVAFDSVTGLFSVTRLYVDDNPTATPADDDLIRAVATDAGGLSGEATATVNVANLAPVATIAGPQVGSVIAVGSPTLLSGAFFDPGLLDTHTAIWRITSLSSPTPIEVAATVNELTGGVSANYTFSEAGIYHLQLVVADDDGGSGSASTVAGEDAYIVVYDTSAGFVTGGGWLQTDAGDYAEGFAGGGRVSFAFVTKYLPGASVPSGNFLIKFAGLTLKSNNFNWLIVSGERAQFQGTGVIDGLGTFGFRVSVFDGDTSGDRIRIEIWNLVTGLTLFDTQWGDDLDADIQTLLGGGSVQIHQT